MKDSRAQQILDAATGMLWGLTAQGPFWGLLQHLAWSYRWEIGGGVLCDLLYGGADRVKYLKAHMAGEQVCYVFRPVHDHAEGLLYGESYKVTADASTLVLIATRTHENMTEEIRRTVKFEPRA